MNTIFALSSGRGKTGVSVIRVSGSRAVDALFAFGINELPKERVATFCKLKKDGAIIDHALVLYFKAPHSFTGEDIVELHLHGSVAVVKQVLEVLGGVKGFRMAEAGEFSKRAFENNKMDLVQAEGLADLIEAETLAQMRQAIRAMEGETSVVYEDWRRRVIEVMAFIEAYIDFPEEDIPANLDADAQKKVKTIIAEISGQVANDNGERLRIGAVATIIGAPNVGKSTLINFLSKRDISIVSDVAGTTRDALEAHLDIGGLPLTLIDTAGIRESEDAIEQEGVRRALDKAAKADFKIIMLEAGQKIDDPILKLIDKDSLVVLNKIDVVASEHLEYGNGVIHISLKNKTGTEVLLEKLKQKLEQMLANSENGIITRNRHRQALQDCVAGLQGFIAARQDKLPIELCAESLRGAAIHLGKITGKIGVEDILDKIFSEFCIGK